MWPAEQRGTPSEALGSAQHPALQRRLSSGCSPSAPCEPKLELVALGCVAGVW